ncbi:hypothetical protein GCM10009549_56820 [Streptomyces thermoalcalitolerans]|uniref:Uncharacterized protein n=1 Tax=Streptomyces thermoalcalitolerans TaxID=65605 RepID=A0ABP4A7S7_9ACTN
MQRDGNRVTELPPDASEGLEYGVIGRTDRCEVLTYNDLPVPLDYWTERRDNDPLR